MFESVIPDATGHQFIDVRCTVTRANLKQSPIAIVYIATGNLSENSNATSRQPQVTLAHAQASAFLKPYDLNIVRWEYRRMVDATVRVSMVDPQG